MLASNKTPKAANLQHHLLYSSNPVRQGPEFPIKDAMRCVLVQQVIANKVLKTTEAYPPTVLEARNEDVGKAVLLPPLKVLGEHLLASSSFQWLQPFLSFLSLRPHHSNLCHSVWPSPFCALTLLP